MTFLSGDPDEDDGDPDSGSSSISSTSATESDEDPSPWEVGSAGSGTMAVDALSGDLSRERVGEVEWEREREEPPVVELERPGGVLSRSSPPFGTSVGVEERGLCDDEPVGLTFVGVDVAPGDCFLADEEGELVV